MADGVTITTGNNATAPTGTKYATDDAGAAGHVPLVKLAYGADGSATQVDAGADGLLVKVSAGEVVMGGISASVATTGSNVNDTTSSTQILASNASRIGWSITNTSSARLFLKFGSGASSTSHVVSLAQWETRGQGPLDGLYTGAIYGIWASDPNDGVAIPTEW